ncbi:isoprenyl transferase [Herbiconiux sp. SALV-R1]|nr:isoprenyl transferase [Herbiconiux sp. SALV-R1]
MAPGTRAPFSRARRTVADDEEGPLPVSPLRRSGAEPPRTTSRYAEPFRPLDWTGLQPPAIPAGSVPKHVAIVMDGNGRWANQRGLTRIEGHRAGEAALLDVVAGAIQIGVKHVSVYAFSTENWKRSPDEVRFLMGFNREVLHRRRDQLNEWGVRIRWAGRKPKLWASVIKELQFAEQLTAANSTLTLTMCVNYGGRTEIADAVRAIADDVAAGRIRPSAVSEKLIQRHLYVPELPDVDLFVRSSGEQRTSNFLPWQSAYAEMVFLDRLWPDFTRVDLWEAIERYTGRARRFGGAVDKPSASAAVEEPAESAAE